MYHKKDIELEEISYFDNRFIDTSTIDLIDFGEHFKNYRVERENIQIFDRTTNTDPHALIHYSQSRKIT